MIVFECVCVRETERWVFLLFGEDNVWFGLSTKQNVQNIP